MLDLSEEMVCIKNSHSWHSFKPNIEIMFCSGGTLYLHCRGPKYIVLTYLYKFSGKVWTLTALSRGLYGQVANKRLTKKGDRATQLKIMHPLNDLKAKKQKKNPPTRIWVNFCLFG